MNIFFLYLDPKECAYSYCDKHVIKIILEITQMLWTAFHLTGALFPSGRQLRCSRDSSDKDWKQSVPQSLKIYRPTHAKHPMSIWVRTHPNNFEWTVKHGLALCQEYSDRYSCKCAKKRYKCGVCPAKQHACQKALEWMKTNIPKCNDKSSTKAVYSKNSPQGCTPIPLCISDSRYHDEDVVVAYRNYYLGEKLEFAVWNVSCPPVWLIESL